MTRSLERVSRLLQLIPVEQELPQRELEENALLEPARHDASPRDAVSARPRATDVSGALGAPEGIH